MAVDREEGPRDRVRHPPGPPPPRPAGRHRRPPPPPVPSYLCPHLARAGRTADCPRAIGCKSSLVTVGRQTTVVGRFDETTSADFDRRAGYEIEGAMHLSRIVVRGFRASAEAAIECTFPGRFSVLVGANNSGKTTVSDALYLGHVHTFPRLPRLPSATLGVGERVIDVEYSYDADPGQEGPLGRMLHAQTGVESTGVAARWTRGLRRDLGSVATHTDEWSDLLEMTRVIYLPAWRNPLDELARREARILVELLRAQHQRVSGSRSLTELRARASALLEALVRDGIIAAVEERIGAHLGALS